jgi:hypothetical protein
MATDGSSATAREPDTPGPVAEESNSIHRPRESTPKGLNAVA